MKTRLERNGGYGLGFPQAVVSRNGQPGQTGSLAGHRTQAFLSTSVLVRHKLVSVVCVDLNHSVSCSLIATPTTPTRGVFKASADP